MWHIFEIFIILHTKMISLLTPQKFIGYHVGTINCRILVHLPQIYKKHSVDVFVEVWKVDHFEILYISLLFILDRAG